MKTENFVTAQVVSDRIILVSNVIMQLEQEVHQSMKCVLKGKSVNAKDLIINCEGEIKEKIIVLLKNHFLEHLGDLQKQFAQL